MYAVQRGRVRVQDVRRTLRFPLLDPLRGSAALWVLTFHYGFSAQFQTNFPSVMALFRVGHLGVPMFFVISGYCLMASLRTALRESEGTGSFMYRRARRIFPPFWFSLAVVAALPFVMEALSAVKTGTFARPTAEGNLSLGFLNYSLADWAKVATLTQVFAVVPNATDLQRKFTTINAVYWTLAIEFQFYVVIGVALAMRSRAMSLLAAVTVLSVPVGYFGLWTVVGVFLPYWPMFAVGIVLFLLLESGVTWAEISHGRSAVLPVVIALAILGAFMGRTLAGRQTTEMAFAVMFAVMLWLFHAANERFVEATRSGGVVVRFGLGIWTRLGLMSYSLYLVHGRLQFLAHQLSRQVLPAGIALDAAAILTTCVMCYGFYWCCERPFVRARVAPVPTPSASTLETITAA
jgi:peptidoglycan/LPS O-acetylase OafA/YrhL